MPDGDGPDDVALLPLLARALAENCLSLHYQPKYDLFRRRITGVEALARWPRPGLPEVPPARFIPLAEAGGIIGDLGAWVLRQACLQAARWRAEGLDLSLAVNVSPLQLAQGVAFEQEVAEALAAVDLPPDRLELEVTEGVLMGEMARRSLCHLREAGMAIALDDFGTGYSSLAYLRNQPATVLKIDKSFVDGLPASLADCMLVEAIAKLAHSFGMTVVAEGVETREQLEVLELMGCDLIQGYALAPPLPAAEVESLLRGHADPFPDPQSLSLPGSNR